MFNTANKTELFQNQENKCLAHNEMIAMSTYLGVSLSVADYSALCEK